MTASDTGLTALEFLKQRSDARKAAAAPKYQTELSRLLQEKERLIREHQNLTPPRTIVFDTGEEISPTMDDLAEFHIKQKRLKRGIEKTKDSILRLTKDKEAVDMTYSDWEKIFLTDTGELQRRPEQYRGPSGEVYDRPIGRPPSVIPYDEKLLGGPEGMAEPYLRDPDRLPMPHEIAGDAIAGLSDWVSGIGGFREAAPSAAPVVGPKTIEAMGQPDVWEHLEAGRLRLQQEDAEKLLTEQIKRRSDPEYAEKKRKEAEFKSLWTQKQRENAPSGVLTFLGDVGSGAMEFTEAGAAHMLYPFQTDPYVQEALTDIAEGKLRIYGGVRNKKEIAARFHNPEGWGRKVGGVAAAAGMSAVALLSPGAGQMAILGAFGLMGTGQGMSEYDRIVKETGITPDDSDRLLMGLGYGVAEAGAEFAGLGGARLGAAIIGKSAAKELGKEAVSNGLMAAVKKYGSKYGIAAIATGSAVEGGEEVLTQVAHNMIRNHYDPRHEWYEDMGEGTVDAFLLGAIGGGMIVGPVVASKGLSNVQMERRIAAQEKKLGARAILEADIDETQQAVEAVEAVTPETIPVQLAEEGEMPKVEVAGEWVEATEEAKAQAVAEKRAEILSGQKGQIENEQGEMVPATPELVEAAMARSKAQLEEMRAKVEEAAPDAEEAAAEAVEEVTEETEDKPAEEPSEAPVEAPVEDAETPVMSGRIVITKGGVPVEETGEGPREWEFGGDTAEQANDLFNRAAEQADAELDRLGDEYDLEIIEDGEDGPLMSPAETVESSEIDDAFRRQQKRRLETRAKRLEDEAAKTEDGEDKARLLRQAAASREQADATARQEGDPPGVKVIPRQEETRTPVYKRLRAWARKSGIRIRQVETRGGIPFEGLYHNGTIYVDASRVRKSKGETSEDAWTTGVFARILSHELVHAGRDVNPRVYDYLRDNLGSRAAGRAFETYRRRLGRSGAGQMQQLSPSLRLEEAVADAVSDTLKKIGAGRFMGDQSIVADLIDFIRSTASKYGLRGKFAKALDDIVRQMSEGKTLSEMAVPDKVRSRPTPPRQLERVMLSPGEALPWSIKNTGDGDLYIRRVGPNAGEVLKERQEPSDFAITVDQSVLLPDYLRYVIMSLQPQLSARKKGTAQQSITQKDINEVLADFFVKQSGQTSLLEKDTDFTERPLLSPAETGAEFNQRQKDWIRVLDMHQAAEDPIQQLWYDDLDMAATMFNESFFDKVKGELPQKDGYFYPDIIEMDNDSTARERVPEELAAEDVIPVREHYRNLTYQWLLKTKGPGPYRLFRGDVKGMHRGQNLPEDMRAGLSLGVFTSSELFTAQEFAGQDKPSAKDKTVEQYDEVWPEEILYAVEAFNKVSSFDESNYLVLADALKPTQTILGRVKKDDFTWMPVWSPTEDLTPEEQKAAEEETLENIAGDDLVAHAAIMIVRDGLSDYGLWYDAMRARYHDSNFDFDAEANEIWRDANVLADYIWDESETGYSARKATELKTKAERDNYSGLRRQLRLQRKAAEDAATEARGEERERGRGRLEKQAREAEAREGRIAARTEAANFRALKHKLRAESAAARQGMVLGRQLGLEKGLAKGAERLERLKMKIQKEKADLKELKSDFRNILKVMGWSSKKLRSKLPTAAVREDFTTRRRMIQIVEEVAEIVEQLRKEHAQNLLRKVLKSLDLNKMRPEFRDAMKEVLDEADIGVREYSPGEDKRLRAVQKYVSSDASRIEQIPNSIVRKMALLRGQKISDLSIEDAQQIREALLQLKHQNNVKNKLLGRGKRRDFLRSRESIIGELDNTFKDAERDSQGRKITKHHWALRRLWSKFNMLTLDRMAMFMGNASRNSESYKRLYADMADGQTEMLRDFQSDKDYLLSEMEAAGIGVTLEAMSEMSEPHSKERGRFKAMLDGDFTGKTRKDPKHTQYIDIKLENGDTLTITPAERITLLMHLRDLDTREQILKRGEKKSEIWIPRLAKRFSLSVEDVNTIEDMQGEARDKENAIAAIILARINGSIRNRMAEYSIELHGYDITRDGIYFPRRRYGTQEAQFDDEAWAEVEQYGIDHSGITKERVGGNLPIILGDAFVEFNNHSYTVAGLKNMAAPMRNMRKLLGNNKTKEFLDAKQRGGDIQKYFRTLLNDLAKDIVGGPGKGAIVDNAATKFARKFTVGALGANPRVMLYQVASLAAASSDMPPQYIGPATRNALGLGGSAITEEMRLRSPYLRERFDSDAYGLVSEGLDRTQGTLVERKKISDRMMGGISKFDEMAIRTIWTASKDWVAHDIRTGKLEGASVGDSRYWEEVRSRAEGTVKRTQPTMDLLHVTPLARAGRRGSGLSRIISMFASQRHKNVNMLWEVYMDLKSGRKVNAVRALAFHSVLQPLILWSMRGVYALAFGELASNLWNLGKEPSPEEEEDDYWTLASMMDSVVSSVFGNLPLGDLPGYATRKVLAEFSEDAPRVREPSVSPVISSAVDITTLLANFGVGLVSEEKEVTESQAYTLIRNMTTASGIPASPLYDLWRSNMGRTTYTELAKRRYNELNRKNTNKELSSEEKSERRKFQRAFRSGDVSKGISALLREAKEAEGKGNMKRAEGLRDRAEKKARRLYGD